MPILEVEHLCKTFERTEVLKDISFSLNQGQVVSIIGSSGSGKTTLLRALTAESSGSTEKCFWTREIPVRIRIP